MPVLVRKVHKLVSRGKPLELTVQSRLRATDLLLQKHNLHEAAWALRSEFHPSSPVPAVRVAYFEKEDEEGIPAKDVLLRRKEELLRMAAEGRAAAKAAKKPKQKPEKMLKVKAVKPLELVQQALASMDIDHGVTGNKVVIPLKGNIRPLQDLMNRHRVSHGLYAVAVRKYLESLRIPQHKVSATWVEGTQRKLVKAKAKPTAKPFGETKTPGAEEAAETEDEQVDKPQEPTFVKQDILEIHVRLKKR